MRQHKIRCVSHANPLVVATLGAAMSLASAAQAVDKFWTGASSSFASPSAWSPAGQPGNADTAIFALGVLTPPANNILFLNGQFQAINAVVDRLRIDSSPVNFTPNASTLTIDSTLTSEVSRGLIIGRNGSGIPDARLDNLLSNLSTVYATLGVDAGSSGTLNVNGGAFHVTGAAAANDLIIGRFGAGTITVNNGADVTVADDTVLGLNAGSSGTISVTGSGSTWHNTSLLSIGDFGAGALNVNSAGTCYADTVFIAHQAGSTGDLAIGGAGSTLTILNDLVAGFAGNGSFAVTGGAHATCLNATVGGAAGAHGDVDVSGAGSQVDVAFVFSVAANGSTATVDVTGGGTISVTNSSGASVIGSGGQVHVSNGVLDINNTLTIQGGSLTADANATVDIPDGVLRSSGTVSVASGATLTLAGQLDLESGGTMQVSSGASLAGHFCRVGTTANPQANLIIDGAGTGVSCDFAIDIGYGRAGRMTVTGGAAVTSPNGAVGSFGATSIGSLTIDGTAASGIPSSWTCSNGPNVALDAGGQGSISVLHGGLLRSNLGMSVGGGGSASVIVDGASPLGAPSLLDASSLSIASTSSASGNVTARSGGRIQSGNVIMAPNGGTAALTVTDRGTVFLQAGAAGINIGQASAGSASITCQNNATFTSGTGAIAVNATGQINLNSGCVFDARGPININGGAFNFLGGTLKGDAFNGSLLNQGGTLAPGHSAGTIAISGNYTQQAAGTLQIEIGGVFPGQWDKVTVQGNALLGGTLQVVLLNGFQPVVGNSFTILTTGVGNVGGTFATLNLPQGMHVTYTPTSVVLNMTEAPCLADINHSGTVNVDDLLAVLTSWGACANPCPPHCAADIAPAGGNCAVNVDDLLQVITHWGPCP